MKKLKTESKIRIFAGTVVLVTAILGYFVHHYWLFVTMFAGLNLVQSGFTGFCPLEDFIEKWDKKK